MHVELITETVNIYNFPVGNLTHNNIKGTQITIGDLHAHAIKLLFMLVKHGIATNINKEDYLKLVSLYMRSINSMLLEQKKELLSDFNAILDKIIFKSECLIRLIGDELSDRGHNDYFTLKILEKLNEQQVQIEILVSNHSIEFIEAYETRDDFRAPRFENASHPPNNHARSIIELNDLVSIGVITREHVLDIVNKAYKSTLRAISYSISENQKTITIYSHAGIGLNTIYNLASKLNISYNDTTILKLAQTIDNINNLFQKHVQNNTVNTLYSNDIMHGAYRCKVINPIEAPFEFIMWNRCYDNLHRPVNHWNYEVNFVHGHDLDDDTQNNIYNLDNWLGKPGYPQGDNTFFYAHKCANTKDQLPKNNSLMAISFFRYNCLKKSSACSYDTKTLPSNTRSNYGFIFNALQGCYHAIRNSCVNNTHSDVVQLIN